MPDPQRDLDELERVSEFEFVGLWDTVGAYGLPIEELQHAVDLYVYPFSFSDRHLSSIVKCAYHALSLDDERRTFHPILWDEKDAADRARIQQVWFPGVHCGVGGGYPKDGLAYISLDWMITKANSLGLRFLDAHLIEIKKQADAHDELYNSRAGLGSYYRYGPRPVTTLGHDTLNEVTIDRPKVHESAFIRICGGRVAYGPIGIPLVYDLVLRDGSVVPGPCEAGHDAKGAIKIVATKSDGERSSPYLEDADRARFRATRMEAVWNIVWWRRIVYYLTLFSSLYLFSLPWLGNALSTQKSFPHWTEVFARYLKPVLTVVEYLVPDWVGQTWLNEFGKEPVLFMTGLMCVAVTMLVGLSLEETIRSRAQEIWHASWRTVPKWAANPRSTWLYKLRSNPSVIKAYRYFTWRVLPTIVLAACAAIVAWLWWKYPKYVTTYVILLLLAIVVRNWVFRAQYTARKNKPHLQSHSSPLGGSASNHRGDIFGVRTHSTTRMSVRRQSASRAAQ